jgi:hypothetical protein
MQARGAHTGDRESWLLRSDIDGVIERIREEKEPVRLEHIMNTWGVYPLDVIPRDIQPHGPSSTWANISSDYSSFAYRLARVPWHSAAYL